MITYVTGQGRGKTLLSHNTLWSTVIIPNSNTCTNSSIDVTFEMNCEDVVKPAHVYERGTLEHRTYDTD
jgi:hypothetical protein